MEKANHVPGFLRSKRFWKRASIGLAILIAIALIANGIMAWRTERRLQNKLTEIRAAGHPASIAELAPAPIPDDQNAAAKLHQITPRLQEFSKDYGKFYNSPLGKAYEQSIDQGEAPTSEQIAAIRAILDNYQDLARDISELATYDQYASQADFTLDPTQFIQATLDDVQEFRTVARFVDWQIEAFVSEDNPELAVKRGMELLHIARLHESEPMLVSFLVGIASRAIAAQSIYDALAAGTISPELHQQLDAELARHDDPAAIVRALRSERALGASFASSAGLGPNEAASNQWLLSVLGWPVKRYYIGALESYDELIALAARPWSEVRAQLGPPGSPPPASGNGVLADMLLPALRAGCEANARNLALLRSLRIYNKLRQYAEANGHEAKSLADLDLPNEATIDPYTGEPLKLKHIDEGWIVYSVAENGADDGGDFNDLKDYGVAPPKHRPH